MLPQAQLLVLSIIVARYLGPDEMGRQSYIAFVALALVQAATAGLPAALSRFIGELLGARRGGQAMSLTGSRGASRRRGGARARVAARGGFWGATPRAAWILAGSERRAGRAAGRAAACCRAPSAGARAWLPGLVTGVATVPRRGRALEPGGGISGLFALEAVAVFANLVWTSALARRLGRAAAGGRAGAGRAAPALLVVRGRRRSSS